MNMEKRSRNRVWRLEAGFIFSELPRLADVNMVSVHEHRACGLRLWSLAEVFPLIGLLVSHLFGGDINQTI